MEHLDSESESGSALLLLSQLANNRQEESSAPSRNMAPAQHTNYHHYQPPHHVYQQQQQQQLESPKRPLNISALGLVKHMQKLEERVKQLEAALQMYAPEALRPQSGLVPAQSPTVPIAQMSQTTQTAQMMQMGPSQSTKLGPVPASLTSIKFNQGLASPQAMDSPITSSEQSSPRGAESGQEFQAARKQLQDAIMQRQAQMSSLPSPTSPTGYMQQLQSPPTQSVWSAPAMVLKDASVKDVQRGILDKVCLPLLEQCYDPDKGQLMALVDQLEKHFYHIDRRVLMSAVRKWFRKRREEMGTRVFMVCKCPEVVKVSGGGGDLKEFLRTLKDNTELLDRIRARVFLEIKNQDQARAFCVEKVDSYFRRKLAQTASP